MGGWKARHAWLLREAIRSCRYWDQEATRLLGMPGHTAYLCLMAMMCGYFTFTLLNGMRLVFMWSISSAVQANETDTTKCDETVTTTSVKNSNGSTRQRK